MIEALKLAACLPFLLYSSYSDLKTRRVSNRVWKLMLLSLSGVVLYETVQGGIPYLFQLLVSFFFIFGLTYFLFRLKAFGGADAKALIVLSLLVPVYPSFELGGRNLPLLGVPSHGIFSLTVFENALILSAIVPLGIFCYNLLHFSPAMLKKPFYMLIAYRVNIGDLRMLLEKGRRVRLVERFEFYDGKLISHFTSNGIVLNLHALSRLEAHAGKGLIESIIWVTPGLPFMISITAGFLTAFILGDLAFYFIDKLIEYW